MPKRRAQGDPDDDEGLVHGRRAGTEMVGWATFESQLPSPPIAVFNRATLHRMSDTSLMMLGTSPTTPCAALTDSAKDVPIIWADLQEDSRSPTLLAVGYADDTVSVFSPTTGAKLWTGSAMGTAAGVIVRDFLALASESAVYILCWTLAGSTHKEIPVANAVMCRHGSLLALSSADGSVVKCRLVDIMTPNLETRDFFSVSLRVGHPLLMASDTTVDGRVYTRIVCSNGIHVYHPGGITTIPGEYSERPKLNAQWAHGCSLDSIGECGIFVTREESVMLIASLSTPGVDIFTITGALESTLWPAVQGNSRICVKAVSSHSGFFSSVRNASLYSFVAPINI